MRLCAACAAYSEATIGPSRQPSSTRPVSLQASESSIDLIHPTSLSACGPPASPSPSVSNFPPAVFRHSISLGNPSPMPFTAAFTALSTAAPSLFDTWAPTSATATRQPGSVCPAPPWSCHAVSPSRQTRHCHQDCHPEQHSPSSILAGARLRCPALSARSQIQRVRQSPPPQDPRLTFPENIYIESFIECEHRAEVSRR